MRPTRASLWSVVLLAGLGACSTGPDTLRMAVSTEEPAPSVAELMVPLIAATGIAVRIEPDDDPGHILESIQSGAVDLAVVEEPSRVPPGVTAIAPLYPSVLHVLVRDDGAAQDFASVIRGRNIYAGPRGGSAERILRVLASGMGIEGDDYTVLDNPWTTIPDVYFVFGGLLSADSLRQLQGYRLFSFGAVDTLGRGSQAEGIVLRFPHLKPFVLPRETYPELTEQPVLTLAVRSLLIAREDLDEQVVYGIASQLFTHAQDIAAVYPLTTRELNPRLDPATLILPLHAGARRYLERDRPGFLERYAEVLALAATILIALISGAFALVKRRSQRKKDRVDVYYARVLEIRATADEATAAQDLSRLGDEIVALQREVFDLVIDERIAADESLSVFLALSNQVLREIRLRQGSGIDPGQPAPHTGQG